MATIDTRIERERERLEEHHEEGKVPTEDYEEIAAFADHLADSDASKTTQRVYMLRLRVLSRRADKPVIEMTTEEMQNLFRRMENGRHPDVKEGGINVSDFQDAVGRFSRWADIPADPDALEYEPSGGNDLTADDLLFQDDVDALLDACGMDIRYKSMYAWMLAAGQRVDAVRSVRLKHVDFDGAAGSIEIPENAQTKGASGTRPMLWAKGYIREWLEAHPFTDANGEPQNPDAALWCPTREHAKTGSPREVTPEPLAPNTVRHHLKRTAERAGIEKRVWCHLLRHTAGTRMVLDGLSEQQIKSLLGWSSESGQFETYAHLADDLRDDSVREAMGLPTSESGTPTIGQPTLTRCPDCNDQMPNGTERCMSCGHPITAREMEEGEPEDVKEDIERTAGQAVIEGDEETVQIASKLAEKIDEDDQFKKDLLDLLE